MSFLVGPVSGALVAGGVYYGFSNLIQTRTQQHKKDLHTLSKRLTESAALTNAPPPAAARVQHSPFMSMVHSKWNQEIEYLFRGFHSWEQRLQDWSRNLLYGDASSQRQTPPEQAR
ncbi:hypothetical protein AMATHDRAFT_144082 [Amanita thiersii Skay4041]|uniref:Found in mitochondrial proteome protein 51 n=1 Tax=Amanita thiersii Skay4041 TaxID=703135 RepID=A0A2A9NRI0_9AGAR|nr:hypothetical protein AMATHDRAFT_144082 [Amanita thiersii Skay4041]